MCVCVFVRSKSNVDQRAKSVSGESLLSKEEAVDTRRVFKHSSLIVCQAVKEKEGPAVSVSGLGDRTAAR